MFLRTIQIIEFWPASVEKCNFTRHSWKIFRENDLRYSVTVWKSALKRYHAKKISVKSHNKDLLNLLLQMHGFLPFRSISRSRRLNRFGRLLHILEIIQKNFFWINDNIWRYASLKMGQLSMLITFFHIRPYQVF